MTHLLFFNTQLAIFGFNQKNNNIWKYFIITRSKLVIKYTTPREGVLLATIWNRTEYFYLFQIVASENPSLSVVLLRRCLRWTSLVGVIK